MARGRGTSTLRASYLALGVALKAGPAMVATSVILAVGFLIVSMASIQSIANFGILCAMVIAVALFADLLLLPSLLRKLHR